MTALWVGVLVAVAFTAGALLSPYLEALGWHLRARISHALGHTAQHRKG